MRKFLIFFIILGLGLGLAGYWHYQRNIYSKESLKLEILGPEEAKIGEEIVYIVKYKNNGTTRLENPLLIFEYPEHCLPSEGKSLREIIKFDDDIYPGEENTLQFPGYLFGKKGEIKTAKASLTFQPKNLKAKYKSETTHTARISSVPLTFEFDLQSRLETGREITFSLNYFSNSDYFLQNLGIKIEYPAGFEFLESSPAALESTEWEIGALNKAEGGRIKIKGKLLGEVGEQRIFKAKLGIWQDGEFIVLKEATHGVRIVEPSLYLSQLINGSPQYIANVGDSLHYEILFRNIGKESFENLFLVVRLEGELFDFESIKSDFGECRPGDNSIIWDWRQVPDLRFLAPGEEGKIEFWIDLKKEWPYSQDAQNPKLVSKVTFPQMEEEFITKVNSKLEVTQKGYIGDEIFGSEGPLPPQAGKKSLFTVLWRVKNFYNKVENVKVKALLPFEVELTGKILPPELTFDPKTREIIWQIEELLPGQGIDKMFQLAFQIALTPAKEPKGEPVLLISEAEITGEDQWTGQILSATTSAIDTTL